MTPRHYTSPICETTFLPLYLDLFMLTRTQHNTAPTCRRYSHRWNLCHGIPQTGEPSVHHCRQRSCAQSATLRTSRGCTRQPCRSGRRAPNASWERTREGLLKLADHKSNSRLVLEYRLQKMKHAIVGNQIIYLGSLRPCAWLCRC